MEIFAHNRTPKWIEKSLDNINSNIGNVVGDSLKPCDGKSNDGKWYDDKPYDDKPYDDI